jgi:thioredoxin-like negative regulator of GroEL
VYAGAEVTTRDLTAENFKRTVDGNDDVLVYFWAPLCAPCEVFGPTGTSLRAGALGRL